MEFKNKEIERQYQDKIENIRKSLEAPVDDTKYLWDETVRKYATNIEQIKRILSDEAINEDVDSESLNLVSNLESFLKQCSNPEFHIALVGTIKAGKSTLINALLDCELASTRVTPETAALTKFHHADENAVKISFYNQDEWNQLWNSANKANNSVFIDDYKALNADAEKSKWIGHEDKEVRCDGINMLKSEIERWTSSKSSVHYFVKEVVVSLKDFDLPEGVVLVDTPGLDDVVDFRSEITRKYIDRANAVLMCIKSDAITAGELTTLYRVFINARDNVEKVYVVATQLDNMNDPKKEWEKQRIEWTKYLKDKKCYRSEKLAQNNLLPVSAYLYTLLNAYRNNKLSIEVDRDRYKTFKSITIKLDAYNDEEVNEQFDNLLDFTNIKKLSAKLNDEVIAKRKEIMMNDIKERYDFCRRSIREVMQAIKKEQEELIESGTKSLTEIQAQRDEYERKLKEVQDDKRNLSEYVESLRNSTQKRIEKLMCVMKGSRR